MSTETTQTTGSLPANSDPRTRQNSSEAAPKPKEYADFQERECEIIEESLPPFICPTCIPDPNAAVPVWWEQEEPFLNTRDCLYQIAIEINNDDEYLTPKDVSLLDEIGDPDYLLGNAIEVVYSESKLQGIKNTAMRKGFLRRGIRELLRFYNKFEANETVCAFGGCVYDLQEIQKWRDTQNELAAYWGAMDEESRMEVSDVASWLERVTIGRNKRRQYKEALEEHPLIYPLGLEWVATIDDVHIELRGNMPIKFLVSIPAFNFDLIPPDPGALDDEDMEPENQIILDARKIKGQLTRLQSSLWVFSHYQQYFTQIEKGRIYFKEEPGVTYTALKYKNKVKEFKDDLQDFLNNNGYRLPMQFGFGRELVSKIKIIFDNSNEKKKYIVKRVEVKAEGCRGWRRIKDRTPRLLNQTNKIQRTLMGYIAKIDEIDRRLTANTTIEWLDFITLYTYPEVKVDYGVNSGNMPQDEQTALGCLLENDLGVGQGQVRNYLLNEVLSLFDVIAYKFNKKNCKVLSEDGDPAAEEAKELQRLEKEYYEELVRKEIAKIDRKETFGAMTEEYKERQEKRRTSRGVGDRWSRKERKSERQMSRAAARDVGDDFGAMTIEEYETEYFNKSQELKEIAERRTKQGSLKYPYFFLAKQAALEKFDIDDSIIGLILRFFKRPDGGIKRPTAETFRKLLDEMGMCGLLELLKKAIQCLLGGMTLEKALKQMVKSALESMTADNLGVIFLGLPADKQLEVETKVRSIVGNTPPPWDSEFVAGSVRDQKTIERIDKEERIFFGQSLAENVGERWLAKQDAKLEKGPGYTDKDFRKDLRKEKRLAARDTKGRIEEQGSIGKTAADVTSVVVKAYIDAIMDSVGVEALMNRIEEFPGAKIITNIILALSCPNQPLIHPPIGNFLKTLTLDICDPTIGITMPRLPFINWPGWEQILSSLKDAVIEALKELFFKILFDLLYKLLVTLESILCKSLEAVGSLAASAVNPNVTGMTLRDAFREAFCGEDGRSDNEVDDMMKKSLEHLGFVSPTGVADSIIDAMSSVGTKDEFLALLVSSPMNHDVRTLNRFSNIVNAAAPEFSEVLGSPDQVSDLFSELGNYISPEDKQQIAAALESGLPPTPINASVCLTNEEKLEWDILRENILSNAGMDPEQANEYIEMLNNRAEDRLGEISNLANEIDNYGTIGVPQLAELLNPNKDDCVNDPIRNIMNANRVPEIKSILDSVSNSLFDQLTINYTKDLVGRRGLFNFILADTKDKVYTSHVRLTRNFIIGRFYADSQESFAEQQEDQLFPSLAGPIGVFPETVSIDLFNTMVNSEINYKSTVGKVKAKKWSRNVDRGIFWEELRVNRKRNAYKKPEFELKYGEIKERERLFSDETYKAGFQVVGGYSNGIFYYDRELEKDTLKKNLNYQVVFDYKYGLNEQIIKNQILNFVVERPILDEEFFYITSLDNSNEWTGIGESSTYAAHLFKKFMSKPWLDVGYSLDNKVFSGDNLFEKVNKSYLNIMKNALITKPGGDILNPDTGNASSGFKFGYKYDDFDPEHFEYVNAKTEEDDDGDKHVKGQPYDWDEEAAVLGKFKKEHPRIHILNPALYGGNYTSPNYYIEPPDYPGWLGLVQSLVPEQDACSPKKADLLDINSIKERVNKMAFSIPYDSRLNIERACASEIPFDKIASSNTLGNLEGAVKAIIRVYLIQSFITGMPVFSNLRMNSGNYDDGFFEFVAHRMKTTMKEQGFGLGFSKITDLNYWLLFLEQVVQTYQRKVQFGEVETNSRIDTILQKIRDAQELYRWPEDRHAIPRGFDRKFTLPGRNLTIKDISGGKFNRYALAYQAFGEDIFDSKTEVKVAGGLSVFYLQRLRFATKILTIRIVESQCIEILKELIKDEADVIFEKFNNNMRPRSPIANIQKYLMGMKELFVGSTLKIGTTKYLMEKQTEGELANPGDIPHVISNPKQQSPLKGGYDTTLLLEQGLFVMEKYIRLVDKEDQTDVPNFVKNRNEKLYGVVNMDDFKNFVSMAPEGLKYSDCFGSFEFLYEAQIGVLLENGISRSTVIEMLGASPIAELDPEALVTIRESQLPEGLALRLNLNPIKVIGDIGVKYGIRICYIPPDGFKAPGVSDEIAMQHKAYKVKQTGHVASKYVFPIASAEMDLLDEPMKNFDYKNNPDDPYDLECMVDKLLLTPEYKMFFDRLVPIRSYTSMIAMFVSLSFLPALGEDSDEREKDDGLFTPNDPEGLGGWERDIFPKSRRKCRSLFAAFYESNDFNPDEEAEDYSLREWIKDSNPFSNAVPGILTWWQRRRLANRPYNKDGEDCGNPFMDLFKK